MWSCTVYLSADKNCHKVLFHFFLGKNTCVFTPLPVAMPPWRMPLVQSAFKTCMPLWCDGPCLWVYILQHFIRKGTTKCSYMWWTLPQVKPCFEYFIIVKELQQFYFIFVIFPFHLMVFNGFCGGTDISFALNDWDLLLKWAYLNLREILMALSQLHFLVTSRTKNVNGV